MNSFFITGTNTGIGKTFFTALLTRHYRNLGIPALALKPFCCGEILTLNQINPVHLLPPLSPYAACVVEERPLDPTDALQSIMNLKAIYPGPFLIEGVGGWLVPITKQYWVRDLARELDLPVIVVASAGLGTLNHSLLTLESIRASGCRIAGVVMNFHACPEDMASATNPAILEELGAVPVYSLSANTSDLDDLPSWLR
jgi:dethiobiotin synthetase